MNDQPDTTTDVEEETPSPLDEYGAGLAERLGGRAVVEFDTVRIYVDREVWVETLRRARDEEGLTFFSWLSGIDWSKDVEVGDTVAEPDELEERFEVMCRLSSMVNADGAQFITTLPKDDAVIDSITGLFGGAEWHEREILDLLGVRFRSHPDPRRILLPDEYEGHPLRKDFPMDTPWGYRPAAPESETD